LQQDRWRPPTQIEKEKLLGVEGLDEVHFFERLLQELNIPDVHVQEVGGKHGFAKRLPLLKKTTGFDKVESIALVRDADTDGVRNAFASLCNVLKNTGLPVPAKPCEITGNGNVNVSIFIMPDNTNDGRIEDIFLQSIGSSKEFDCLKKYFKCFDSQYKDGQLKFSKQLVLGYLAAKSDTANSLGFAAQQGIIDFSHRCFEEIKKFLKDAFI